MTQPDYGTLRAGDVVLWRGAYGRWLPRLAAVLAMERPTVHDSDNFTAGPELVSIPWADVLGYKIVVDVLPLQPVGMSPKYWAHAYQLMRVGPLTNIRPGFYLRCHACRSEDLHFEECYTPDDGTGASFYDSRHRCLVCNSTQMEEWPLETNAAGFAVIPAVDQAVNPQETTQMTLRMEDGTVIAIKRSTT